MSSAYEFVYALVLENEDGDRCLAISPCGSADPKDLAFLDNGACYTVKECIYINRLSEEFKLLEKMMDLSKVSAVYALVWENENEQEVNDGTSPGDP